MDMLGTLKQHRYCVLRYVDTVISPITIDQSADFDYNKSPYRDDGSAQSFRGDDGCSLNLAAGRFTRLP
jgi:hypothetical protein